ncbi:alkylated DNA repair protein alkB homolog 8-like [Daktulosphaira vitifoliae]|uniref:alkylated DNA repair protein alkB homolog 8-like n=1 Tax=Daktulosphaira vitifoliae TaxID=58002 RepID=UPI0021A9B91F|nr:alkylated DNA repair protein alkB homolog 8-like [Daktulosphaira vitifoliae]
MISLNEKNASQLEFQHVHNVYENIASHFSDTRQKPWPNVVKFINKAEPGSIILDVGCGNAKYFTSNSTNFQVGCDRSTQLAQICKSRNHQVFNCDCLQLPLRSNCIDFCINIAVLHHLSTSERRFKALNEIFRVLRKGGQALIYVWAKEQKRNETPSTYLKQKKAHIKNSSSVNDTISNHYHVEKIELDLPIHTNRSNFIHNDLLVPWKLNKNKLNDKDPVTHLRFYHVFEETELKSLCERISNCKIIEYYYDQGNWCIIFEKLLNT